MGVEYYNPSSGSSSVGGGIFYRPKPLTLPSQLYSSGTTSTASVPVWRSGAGTKSFEGTANTGITLYTTSSTGVRTSTASITYTTYLASALAVAFHLNSADTCLYVLISSGGSFRFIKIDDTTGVVTTIGSSFTPTTVANWGGGSPTTGLLSVDTTTGHLKYTNNGFYHLINKATGAIVSQDTPISIGSYLGSRVFYVTQDGVMGVTMDNGAQSGGAVGFTTLPRIVHSSYGHISSYVVASATYGGFLAYLTTTPIPLHEYTSILVDNDKICISRALFDSSNSTGAKYYSLSEWDKFIKSVAEVGAGVI